MSDNPAPIAGQRLETLSRGPKCARVGCGKPVPPRTRQRGSKQRYCSSRCRALAFRAEHPLRSHRPAPPPVVREESREERPDPHFDFAIPEPFDGRQRWE